MPQYEILAKRNRDGSYSASIPAGMLVANAFVDYYTDATGGGYQRDETLRPKRARDIADYIRRCLDANLEPKLFELTINARLSPDEWRFEGLDDDATVGFLSFEHDGTRWLSVTDGGTRLDGIKNALAQGTITDRHTIDARVFVGLTLGEEVAQFLLINEKQKRVRTDLSLRVVQRKLDDGALSDHDLRVLTTVVPDQDAWKYEASRIASILNSDTDSCWSGRIQMPNDHVTRPVKLQAFLTSLKPLLANDDLKSLLDQMEQGGHLMVGGTQVGRTEFLSQVIKNFWAAVAEVNPDAHAEPHTTVLWGSIGASAGHAALTPILVTKLQGDDPSLTLADFRAMTQNTTVADYPFWFTAPGSQRSAEDYPATKGEATTFTGAAGYGRLARQLETEWRAALHSTPRNRPAVA